MRDDSKNQEKSYWSKEIADHLGIGTSTLRKWCLLLEENGYVFLRDEHGRRAYTEHDAIALRQFKELTTEKAMSLENASIVVISAYNRKHNEVVTLSATENVTRSEQRHDERFDALESRFDTYMEQQEAFQKALLEQLQKRDEYIENVLKTRDERLLQTMNEILETKRLLVAAQEQQQDKKKWFQFWKK